LGLAPGGVAAFDKPVRSADRVEEDGHMPLRAGAFKDLSLTVTYEVQG
jgi:hypothetical protein